MSVSIPRPFSDMRSLALTVVIGDDAREAFG